MNYKVVDRIEEASHWIALEDENNIFSSITVNKLYELKLDEREREYYIIDDKGTYSLIFLAHHGDYIIK